jgi:uncharacterized protein with ATP-grasp and redox domains
MSIQSECVVCTMRQASDVCDFVGAEESKRQALLRRVMQILIQGIESDSEENVGFQVHEELKRITDSADPYKAVKEQSIQSAILLLPRLVDLVENSDKPLRTAVELSIAGNVIDFGPSRVHNMEAAIDEVLNAGRSRFDFDAFHDAVTKARRVLILGDNAGETVFDRPLISQLDREVFYAVKSRPILNDATRGDAIDSGLDVVATIVENGSPRSGTYLPWCSQQFLDLYHSADLVISKGQANFETLVNETRRIFFLLKVKCKLLSRRHGLPLGEYVLIDNWQLSGR